MVKEGMPRQPYVNYYRRRRKDTYSVQNPQDYNQQQVDAANYIRQQQLAQILMQQAAQQRVLAQQQNQQTQMEAEPKKQPTHKFAAYGTVFSKRKPIPGSEGTKSAVDELFGGDVNANDGAFQGSNM